MSKEETALLIKDLCGRLAHGVMVRTSVSAKPLTCEILSHIINGTNNFTILPYLRPMYSMTDDEVKEYLDMLDEIDKSGLMHHEIITKVVDWLDKKMIDHRGLIPMGLAIEATEGMYNTKTE